MYRHLLFDLDHTLWDFDRNSNETLTEMHTHFGMGAEVDLQDFIRTFVKVNVSLWEKHNANVIDQHTLRTTRFPLVFEALGVPMPISGEDLSAMYLDLMPRKPHVLPYALELLEYLKPKYTLHIITNGFPEIQDIKLASSNITHYFDLVVTSAVAGYKKPSKEVFDYTLQAIQASPAECLMIGDNWEADIIGGRNAGIDQVYFCPDLPTVLPAPDAHTKTYHIKSLQELMTIL
ncbi:MAG: noncanonical pyrimidine nucleotidase, YjjG family [Bacteroidetes bacterium]|nr:MAG: noncanonical pyrimidine nucleotidase, YjjG family [Bacteroidota bacterium]